MASMLAFFDRICVGEGGLLLVPGSSGVGKTALVRELQQPLLDRNGFFCQGKFDQYQQNVPYHAVQQAMGELWQSLCDDCPEHQYESWRNELQEAVGGQGQPLIDMNSEVAELIGPQPPLENINPHEARHRFAHVFLKAIKVFCKPDHPLILFMDDWQWVDAASLDLLRHLLVEETPKYFLIIAAYRDNEVDARHPFAMTLEEIRHRGGNVKTVPVEPLEDGHIRQFMSDALTPGAEDLDGLVRIVSDRTQGNPFFIHALVHYLHDMGYLWFEEDAGTWRWSGGPNDRMVFPVDVAELFTQRFQRRSPETQEMLGHAACLGSRFAVSDLAIVTGQTEDQCLALLSRQLEKGFLLQGTTGSRCARPRDCRPVQLRFVHDRVQQAAYGLISPERLPKVKLGIARTLWRNRKESAIGETLFGIVDNYNAGMALLTDPAERLDVVFLNIKAAKKAMSGAAYRAAMQLHRAGGRVLEDPETSRLFWEKHAEAAMEFHLDWSGTEFLEGDQDRADELSLKAIEHAKTPLERAEAERVRIVQYTLQARYAEAIAAGRDGLQALGINLPAEEYAVFRDREIEAIRRKLEHHPLSGQAAVPAMSDPEKVKATQLLITMGPPCYRAHQHLWSVMVPTAVNLMLEHGNLPQVGYSHTAMAGLLIWVADDFGLAREFQDLAVQLMKNVFESPSDQSVFYLMIGSSARHWFTHMRRSRRDYEDAYDIGQRHDNLQYAAYAFGHNLYCGLFMGMNLNRLRDESVQSLAFSRTRHNQWAIDLIEGGLRTMAVLAGDGEPVIAEDEYLERVQANGNIQVECIYSILRAFHLLVMNAPERALPYSNRAQELIHTVGSQGLLPWPEHLLVRGLLFLELGADSREAVAQRDEIRARFAVWAEHCPENYLFKHHLFEAEFAVAEGRKAEAAHHFEAAIEAAEHGLFTQWAGIANERAARFWETGGQSQIAQSYWQHAYSCYESWGATSKLREMEQRVRIGLESFLSGTEGSEQVLDAALLVRGIMDKQVAFLHSPERQEEEVARRQQAEQLAGDLAQSTARLREEVAARKAAEMELREQSQRLRLTFDQSPIGIAVTSLDLQFVQVNGQICHVLGHEWQGLHALKVSDVLHPEDAETGSALFKRIMTEGSDKLGVECRFVTRENRTVWCRMTVGVMHGEDGAPLNFLLTLEDISEQKEAEQKLIAAREEALEANKSKSRFLANMSHEVRTPINGILGMLQLMKTTPLNEEQEDYADTAIQSCNRLTRLLSDILDLSRVEAGRLEIAEEEYELREVTDSINSLFTPVARQKGIDFVVTLDDSVPKRLAGDSIRLQQVVSNLVGNAIKFTDEGTVRLEAWATSPGREDHCRIVLRVSDTGVGIPLEKQESLFEPFTQAENTYTRTHQGAGLGLAITRELIHLMQGELALVSEVGMGTEFYVSIPQQVVSETSAAVKSAREDACDKPLNVLLAEDDSVSSLVAKRLLQKSGHSVHSVENGREALDALDHNDFDIVLMDIQMPVMDGVDATRAIREGVHGEDKRDIPIIALTAFVMSGDKEKFLSRGFSGYLAKPLDVDSLQSVLSRHVDPDKCSGNDAMA